MVAGLHLNIGSFGPGTHVCGDMGGGEKAFEWAGIKCDQTGYRTRDDDDLSSKEASDDTYRFIGAGTQSQT